MLTEQIGSVVALETLLLFYRQPYREMSSDEVAAELRVASYWTYNELKSLAQADLLRCGDRGRYHYDPSDSRICRHISALAAAYARRPLAVISFIYSRSEPAEYEPFYWTGA